MVQDSELPENNNLNAETNTHFDDKKIKIIYQQIAMKLIRLQQMIRI